MRRIVAPLLLAFLASLAVPAGAAADTEEERISSVLHGYWRAFASGDYSAAADFVSPQDLRELRGQVLPVFLEAGKSSDPEVLEVTAAFFAAVPQSERARMSERQIFQGVNRIIMAGQPALARLLWSSSIEIDRVERDGNRATVHYTIAIVDPATSRSVTQEGSERLVKTRQGWRLRLKEEPGLTAAKFRQLFGG